MIKDHNGYFYFLDCAVAHRVGVPVYWPSIKMHYRICENGLSAVCKMAVTCLINLNSWQWRHQKNFLWGTSRGKMRIWGGKNPNFRLIFAIFCFQRGVSGGKSLLLEGANALHAPHGAATDSWAVKDVMKVLSGFMVSQK